ncbi:hypothetical protein DENSPDRAFT_798498 [Dentipellis sp. KUC8613]|nr:hypothetical protein DENSPDRAFT_798498 [Dentipellis sp. KUC8613]
MASASRDLQKPLPSLPQRTRVDSQYKLLSVESRQHLRAITEHVIAEEQFAPWHDGEQAQWAGAVEGAVDELADAVVSEGWLAGIKRAKVSRRRRRLAAVAAETIAEKEKTGADKDSGSREKGKDKGPPVSEKTKSEHLHGKEDHEEKDVDDHKTSLALQQIRSLASKPSSPSPRPLTKHLLLTVAAFGEETLPSPRFANSVASGSAPRCAFTANEFCLPEPGPAGDMATASQGILYGLREWDADEAEQDLRLVGGTFSFYGMKSSAEHATLTRVLRVAIYTRLSLLLEQHLLSDSHVEIRFPKAAQPTIPSVPTVPLIHRTTSPDVKPKSRDLHLPSSIWSFFSKKTGNLLQRASTTNPNGGRRGSLDLPQAPHSLPEEHRASLDVPAPSSIARKFSIFGDHRQAPLVTTEQQSEPPFEFAVRRIEQNKGLLSTSPGIVFPIPIVLARLAEEEKKNPNRKLRGEERSGLTSVLGWEGREARGRGMVGAAGFSRQQSLSVLYSERVPAAPSVADTPSRLTSSPEEQKPYAHCGVRASWRTLVFYTPESQEQVGEGCLGDVVARFCGYAEDRCARPGCEFTRGQHELRWIHNQTRIVANVTKEDEKDNEGIEMWQSCKICNKTTSRSRMSDATYLISFAKFLELLVYSPAICTLSQSLCSHTTPPPKSWTGPDSPLPQSRLNIVRHFSTKSHTISLSLSLIQDVFELRVPRLQFCRGGSEKAGEKEKERGVSPTQLAVERKSVEGEEEKRALRKEIKDWWQGIAEHLDKLEMQFIDDETSSYHKSLPRLPSADDAYERHSDPNTPKAGHASLPSSLPATPFHESDASFTSVSTIRPPSPQRTESSSSVLLHLSNSSSETISLLSNMRYTFQRTEQMLYEQLSQTPISTLNDVRRSFHDFAKGATKRLSAWELKHVPKSARPQLAADREAIREPGWWHSRCHAVPGGNVIIREEDWGSIIAFTLSSLDYQRELSNLSPRSGTIPIPPPQITTSVLTQSPAASSTSSFKLFSSSNKPQADPDREDTVWQEPETCSAVITRKEHPRDPTSLISIRDVLRHKAPASVDGSLSLPSSALAGIGLASGRSTSGGAPPLAYAKPAVEVNTQAAGGQVTNMPEAAETAERILQEMDASSVASSKNSSDLSSSAFLETSIRRGKAASLISNQSNGTVRSQEDIPTSPPTPPPKELPLITSPVTGSVGSSTQSSKMSIEQKQEDEDKNYAMSWTNSLTNAMRYMLNTGEQQSSPPPNHKGHHGLLSSIDPLLIDERPHIKYDWTIGKRLKFSCTVYYAKQFDGLRRRCGVEDVFLKSMACCENWAAEGGKSRSNFWKTADDRFIIKTLVNAWNVADLQVLIDLAPSYFRHMESTASKPSFLAKLLGFYTVEVKNLETGTTQSKADLLVMENLFYNQKVTKTFDLKGIQGRKVKTSTSASKILFDGEWIEGQQRALTLVYPHSKAILNDGLKSDCEFLARSNIMDYSLLLGVDEEHRQTFCGLVDTIGSYTFAKTLEYKAKQGFLGKDITVIPPHEYQERFLNAMDRYFIACPDKWARPHDDTKVPHDPLELPSVL